MIACPNVISEDQRERKQQSGAWNNHAAEHGSGATIFCYARSNLLCGVLRDFLGVRRGTRNGQAEDPQYRSTECRWDSSALCQQGDDTGYCVAQNRPGEALAYANFIGNAADNLPP